MKIGTFDSGLGGLIITHSLINQLPQYDYLYLGDTARLPYGNRSQETIYNFVLQSVDYLMRHNCQLVILACNTASAEALRRIQQEYLPTHYPDRRVLGVLIPTAEVVAKITLNRRIGVLATSSTVSSGAFTREIRKLIPNAQVFQNAAPLLVPLVENNGLCWAKPILTDYLKPLLAENIDSLILGCTHYPFLKTFVREICGDRIRVISQDEIIPAKLANYLSRHPEIAKLLSKKGGRDFWVTELTEDQDQTASRLFGNAIQLKLVSLV